MGLDIGLQIAINLITLGAFYGATKVEINWIKQTLIRHEDKIDAYLGIKKK